MEYKNQTENRAFQEMLLAAVKRLQNRSGLALLQPLVILGGSGKLNVASRVQRRLDRILDDTNDKADMHQKIEAA